jgi:hypothetical protein
MRQRMREKIHIDGRCGLNKGSIEFEPRWAIRR